MVKDLKRTQMREAVFEYIESTAIAQLPGFTEAQLIVNDRK